MKLYLIRYYFFLIFIIFNVLKIFKLWSTIRDNQIIRFTRDSRDTVPTGKEALKPMLCISTYSMVAYTGKRTYVAEESMRYLESVEWGLLLLDGILKNKFLIFYRGAYNSSQNVSSCFDYCTRSL